MPTSNKAATYNAGLEIFIVAQWIKTTKIVKISKEQLESLM